MQRDAALTAVPGSIGRCIPQRSARRINADDIGPLISQQHGSERSCDVLAKIDDPNAVEYTEHTFPPSQAEQGARILHLYPRILVSSRAVHHTALALHILKLGQLSEGETLSSFALGSLPRSEHTVSHVALA